MPICTLLRSSSVDMHMSASLIVPSEIISISFVRWNRSSHDLGMWLTGRTYIEGGYPCSASKLRHPTFTPITSCHTSPSNITSARSARKWYVHDTFSHILSSVPRPQGPSTTWITIGNLISEINSCHRDNWDQREPHNQPPSQSPIQPPYAAAELWSTSWHCKCLNPSLADALSPVGHCHFEGSFDLPVTKKDSLKDTHLCCEHSDVCFENGVGGNPKEDRRFLW